VSCVGCQTSNDAARRFCRQCGKSLIKPCQGCAFANQPADKFCGGCGVGLEVGAEVPAPKFQAAAPVAPVPTVTKPVSPDGPLSPQVVAELLRKSSGATTAPTAKRHVSQDELDALFGA
jgi:hypothetical protein